MSLPCAEIITIGDELCYGHVTSTHAAYLSARLSQQGFSIAFHTTVGDDIDAICAALTIACARADLLLLTGGLGPTHDDRTKAALASFLHLSLEHSDTAAEQVQAYWTRRSSSDAYPVVLAQLPAGAEPLPNRAGLAPGLWLAHAAHLYIALPGVPYEMKVIFEEEALPRLCKHFSLSEAPRHAFVHTLGVPESTLSKRLRAFERDLPPALTLAYLPEPGHVLVRLSLRQVPAPGSPARKEDATLLSREHAKLCTQLRDCSYSTKEQQKPAEALAQVLQRHGHSLAIAESCTGGYLAHLFTQIAGASQYFLGAVVAYTPEAKRKHLDVKAATLETKGVVSKETAMEMALGVRKRFSADWGLATTGVAGPSQGDASAPVGTVWIACADAKGDVYAQRHRFAGDRHMNIRASAAYALALLKERWEAICTALHQKP